MAHQTLKTMMMSSVSKTVVELENIVRFYLRLWFCQKLKMVINYVVAQCVAVGNWNCAKGEWWIIL